MGTSLIVAVWTAVMHTGMRYAEQDEDQVNAAQTHTRTHTETKEKLQRNEEKNGGNDKRRAKQCKANIDTSAIYELDIYHRPLQLSGSHFFTPASSYGVTIYLLPA